MFTIATAASIIAAASLFSCQSSEKKIENAEENVVEANQELREVKIDSTMKAQKVATAEEWKQFKKEADVKISYYDIRIKELKTQMKQSGNKVDVELKSKIDGYELNSKALKERIEVYTKTQSDWETFKMEYNHDLAELGKALKDITVKNIK